MTATETVKTITIKRAVKAAGDLTSDIKTASGGDPGALTGAIKFSTRSSSTRSRLGGTLTVSSSGGKLRMRVKGRAGSDGVYDVRIRRARGSGDFAGADVAAEGDLTVTDSSVVLDLDGEYGYSTDGAQSRPGSRRPRWPGLPARRVPAQQRREVLAALSRSVEGLGHGGGRACSCFLRRSYEARPARGAGGAGSNWATSSRPASRPRLLAIQAIASAGLHRLERHGAVALGQARAVGAEHQRHMRVGRLGQPEQPASSSWRGRGVQQVVAAHHLADALVGVVHHHREVVGGRAVAAAQSTMSSTAPEPGRGAGRRTPAAPRARPAAAAGGRPVWRSRSAPVGRGQAAAGAGVGALGQGRRAARWRPRRISARVHQHGYTRPCSRSRSSACAVELGALGLAHDRLRPSRCPTARRSASCAPRARAGALRIEVLDPQRGSAPPLRAANSHASSGGAQVAQVQAPVGLGAKRP